MKPRTWTRLSKGIYRTTYGIRAVVHIAAGRQEKFFDLEYPLPDIKRWRNETRTLLETLHPERRAGAHGHNTFNADMKRHLSTLTISSWKSRRSELRAWADHWGPMKRWRSKQEHAKAVIKIWFDASVPPKTIQNRCRALSAMYHDLDGPKAWTPVDGLKLPKITKTRKPFVSADIMQAVEVQLRTLDVPDRAQWHARFMVIAACGSRPVFVKRTKPTDVDLERRVWSMGSAKDGEPVELFLNDEMLAAWEAFAAANAWGDFDATEYATVVRAAGWPAHLKPYATKHTVGRELGERGVDMQVIADWFGHTDVKTTRESYVPVLNSKLRQASEVLNGRLGWKPASGRFLDQNVVSFSEEDRNRRIEQLLAELKTLIA